MPRYVMSDRDRFGNLRYYLRRNGVKSRLPGVPGMPDFQEAYREIMKRHEAGEIRAVKRGQPGEGHAPPGGFVYLIKCGDYFKVGYTKDPKQRASGLHTGMPHPMDFMVCIPGNRSIEKALHRKFAKNATHREWFRVGPNFFDLLSNIMKDDKNKTGVLLPHHDGAT